MKNFTSYHDVDDLQQWIQTALELKGSPLSFHHVGKGKTIGLLFFNLSLRTRLSTQKAAMNLGLNVMVMNINDDGWKIEMEDGSIMDQGAQEHIKDAIKVISQYCDLIGVRTFASLKNLENDYAEQTLNKFLEHASVPVVSLESATLHPLQSLADVITIEENKLSKTPKIVLTWAPHPKALPQAVANSFVQWISHTDAELLIANPEGFDLAPSFTQGIKVTHNQEEALKDADFVYAKNWSSYALYGAIGNGLDHWKITTEKMQITNNAQFMHCLPVRRNVVVDDAVLDHPSSLIYELANNRTYAAQTVLLKLLKQ